MDFTGGEKMVLNVDPDHKPSVEDIRKIASSVSKREVLVSYQRNVGTGRDTLQITSRDTGETNQANITAETFQAFKNAFPIRPLRHSASQREPGRADRRRGNSGGCYRSLAARDVRHPGLRRVPL